MKWGIIIALLFVGNALHATETKKVAASVQTKQHTTEHAQYVAKNKQQKVVDKQADAFEKQHPELMTALYRTRNKFVGDVLKSPVIDAVAWHAYDTDLIITALEADQPQALSFVSEDVRKELFNRVAQRQNYHTVTLRTQHNKLYERMRKELHAGIVEIYKHPLPAGPKVLQDHDGRKVEDMAQFERVKRAKRRDELVQRILKSHEPQLLKLGLSRADSELMLKELMYEFSKKYSKNLRESLKHNPEDAQNHIGQILGRTGLYAASWLYDFFRWESLKAVQRSGHRSQVPVYMRADGTIVAMAIGNKVQFYQKEQGQYRYYGDLPLIEPADFVGMSEDLSLLLVVNCDRIMLYAQRELGYNRVLDDYNAEPIRSVAITDNGSRVAVGDSQGDVYIYQRTNTGAYQKTQRIALSGMDAQVAFNGTGSMLLVGNGKKSVILYVDTEEGYQAYKSITPYDWVSAVSMSERGSLCAVACDTTVSLYKNDKSDLLKPYTEFHYASNIKSVQMHGQGNMVGVLCEDNTIHLHIWQKDKQYDKFVFAVSDDVHSFACSAGTSTLLTGGCNGQAKLYTTNIPDNLTLEQLIVMHEIYTASRENIKNGYIAIPDADYEILPVAIQKLATKKYKVIPQSRYRRIKSSPKKKACIVQ